MHVQSVNVLGVGISVLDQDRARDFLFAAARSGQRGYVAVTGVHGVAEAQGDSALKRILEPSASLHARRDVDGLNGTAPGRAANPSSMANWC